VQQGKAGGNNSSSFLSSILSRYPPAFYGGQRRKKIFKPHFLVHLVGPHAEACFALLSLILFGGPNRWLIPFLFNAATGQNPRFLQPILV